jgi:hypothetical protein
MTRVRSGCIAVLVVLGADMVAASAASARPTGEIRTQAAGAFFDQLDAGGCVRTTIDIAGFRERSSTIREFAETFVHVVDECRGQDLVRASEAGTQAIDFEPRQLGHAELRGAITVHDFVTDRDLQLTVELEWDGVGRVTTDRSGTQRHSTRRAEANGELRLEGVVLVNGRAASGALEDVRTRTAG